MHLDLQTLSERERYKLLMSSVVPRPIALVTSLDLDGRVNAAPYSCFNIMGTSPALLVLGIDSRETGVPKDTSRNIHLTDEFVVNLVNEPMAAQASRCGAVLPAGESELAHSGLTAAPCEQVQPPRIAESPISLECRRHVALDVGNGRNIVVGHILHYHIQDRYYDAEHGYVLAAGMGMVARMHGRSWYVRSTDLFEIAREDGGSHH